MTKPEASVRALRRTDDSRSVESASRSQLAMRIIAGLGLALSGCSALPGASTSASSTGVARPGDVEVAVEGPALVSVLPDALYQLPVKPGEAISDGAIVVENGLDRPFVLTRIEPVFQFGRKPDNVTVLGTRVVTLPGPGQDENGSGIQRGFPLSVGAGEQSFAVKGFQVAAGRPATRRQALVLGLRVDQGMAVVVGLRVDYRLAGVARSQLISHQLILCADQPPGAARCPEPPTGPAGG